MNYLAHVFLSGEDPELQLGNFYGDFVKNSEIRNLTKTMQFGIQLHREIDSFTDAHSAVDPLIKLLRPHLGKYAPVATDILFDYLLCKNWNNYSDVPLRAFCDTFYEHLFDFSKYHPKKLENKAVLMLEADFLMSTSTDRYLTKTFMHMERRAKYVSNFTAAQSIMNDNLDVFELAFGELIIDLIGLSQSRIQSE